MGRGLLFRMNDLVERRAVFIGARADYDPSYLVVVGAPMDFTASWRPGSRTGPVRIREVSESLEEYSPRLERDLGTIKFCDIGDVIIPYGDVEGSLTAIKGTVKKIFADGKRPIVLGGEHLITLPVISALKETWEDNGAWPYDKRGRAFPVIIHFDAHADLRDDYMGQKLSHATVMRRVSEVVGGHNIYQFGVRSGTREEYEFASRHTNLRGGDFLESLSRALREIEDAPVYVTLDIDIIDPAFAPATGNPEPGGVTSRELLEAIWLLKGLDIVGFDLVEVAPVYDRGDITSILAAKIVREALLIMGTS